MLQTSLVDKKKIEINCNLYAASELNRDQVNYQAHKIDAAPMSVCLSVNLCYNVSTLLFMYWKLINAKPQNNAPFIGSSHEFNAEPT